MHAVPIHPVSTWHPSIADPGEAAPSSDPLPSPDAADVALLRQGFGRFLVFESTLRRLAAAAHRVHCPPGPLTIASPCTPEAAWWLVARGTVSMGAAAGAFVEKRRIGAGEWLDVAGALSAPGTWIDQAVCRTPVDLLAVPLSAIVTACAADTSFTGAFAGVLADRVRDLNAQVDDMGGAEAPVRLARWLLRQIGCAAADDGHVRLVLRQRKHSIARLLCTTSETLSRTLRRLSDAGVLEVRDYTLTILDLPALRTIAHGGGMGRRAARAAAPGRRSAGRGIAPGDTPLSAAR